MESLTRAEPSEAWVVRGPRRCPVAALGDYDDDEDELVYFDDDVDEDDEDAAFLDDEDEDLEGAGDEDDEEEEIV